MKVMAKINVFLLSVMVLFSLVLYQTIKVNAADISLQSYPDYACEYDYPPQDASLYAYYEVWANVSTSSISVTDRNFRTNVVLGTGPIYRTSKRTSTVTYSGMGNGWVQIPTRTFGVTF